MTMSSMNAAWSSLLLLLFLLLGASALDQDGVLLLSFKYSILDDPLSALSSWSYDDDTPCSWNGVTCMGFPDQQPGLNSTTSRVISLVLPGSRLLGSVPSDVGLIEHLRHLDLSDNLLSGTLPASLFNASELRVMSLAGNEISGDMPDAANLSRLELLNISHNALTGTVPPSLSLAAPNVSVVSLRDNHLSGRLPGGGGFSQVRVLDLSSNLFNSSVPADLVGSTSTSLQYLNLSSNRLSGEIPSELGKRLPIGASLDFSFNNFTGGIPDSAAFLSQSPMAFAGNGPDLCGKPLKSYCPLPSSLSNRPNVSAATATPPESPPAFAAIPKTTADGGGGSLAAESGRGPGGGGFQPVTIAAIVVGDLVGIGLLVVVFLYAYQVRKRRRQQKEVGAKTALGGSASESKATGGLSCCLRKKDIDSQEESTETSSSSEGEEEGDEAARGEGKGAKTRGRRGAILVTVDGDTVLEMETLLKASAYVLGATGTTIVYKAVLADGTALAVRRIGECPAAEKLKDFEAQVRSIARLRHPNLLRLCGFYWGPDEKLLIHDYAPNGSLANISFSKKLGSSPLNLNLESRLRIARGVARGLAYIHERKSVHGNVKPSNILLGADMEAKIGDFGLDRLLSGGRPAGASCRLFGSKRSVQSQSSLPDQYSSPVPAAASPVVAGASPLPYQAPESLQNLKPNAKWDVYSFGVVLLELMSGRVLSEEELGQWNAAGFAVEEERRRVLRMADPALRGEAAGKEEAVLSCFGLGFACAAVAPQRRPTMKEAAMTLDRIPSASATYLLH
ncbi:putative LRR receptor-like serine/threonine-protein kinase [Iris pallida]|uniref:LRR receptor-like serine/threonine-protein kinase n=1 Tax=Iris pallida TaxID=29817 RepID=A0AAX6EVF7_IRIPA|nr:putative LRR receptor-like serine/threonine-protein kinase [Iris pallida]KAJ6854350.1 putative LRR receptor-like serine/threonine-protein kinase [Iris pallida]